MSASAAHAGRSASAIAKFCGRRLALGGWLHVTASFASVKPLVNTSTSSRQTLAEIVWHGLGRQAPDRRAPRASRGQRQHRVMSSGVLTVSSVPIPKARPTATVMPQQRRD